MIKYYISRDFCYNFAENIKIAKKVFAGDLSAVKEVPRHIAAQCYDRLIFVDYYGRIMETTANAISYS